MQRQWIPRLYPLMRDMLHLQECSEAPHKGPRDKYGSVFAGSRSDSSHKGRQIGSDATGFLPVEQVPRPVINEKP